MIRTERAARSNRLSASRPLIVGRCDSRSFTRLAAQQVAEIARLRPFARRRARDVTAFFLCDATDVDHCAVAVVEGQFERQAFHRSVGHVSGHDESGEARGEVARQSLLHVLPVQAEGRGETLLPAAASKLEVDIAYGSLAVGDPAPNENAPAAHHEPVHTKPQIRGHRYEDCGARIVEIVSHPAARTGVKSRP